MTAPLRQPTPVQRPATAYAFGMRKITLLAVHCTATLAGRPFNVDAIRAMHLARGWSDIGYHKLIGIAGETWDGRPESLPGAHAKGFNAASLAVCYVGGIGANGRPTDTRTDAQTAALAAVLKEWRQRFPDAKIRGHRDLSPDLNRDGRITSNEWLKDCPCFDVRDWCHTVGIDPK